MSIITKIRGFANLGNTCYMNATLQGLLSSNIVNTALLMYIQRKSECMGNLSPVLLEYIRLIMDHVKNNDQGIVDMATYSPNSFKNILDHANPWFRGNAQHDSNELLVYMINEFSDEKKDKGMGNLIRKLCFGKFKQYVCCSECKHEVVSYFKFLDVILPIPNQDNPDLEGCFKKFAKYEIMDGDNKWECPACNKKVVAYKKMEIEEVPEVAVFTFNRFRGTTKNKTPIRIYQYIELEGKKLKLIATINHLGSSIGGGHYIACVSRNDKWYIMNDSSIHETRVDSILNDSSVYMTIYQIDE